MFQREGTDLTIFGFVLLAVFGSLVWNENPLKSQRPYDSSHNYEPSIVDNHTYDAHLWEDPFSLDLSKIAKDNENKPLCHNKLRQKIASLAGDTVKILAPMINNRSDGENIERRIRRRYAVIAGLSESGYISTASQKLHYCFSLNSKGQVYDVRWEHFKSIAKPGPDKEPIPDILVIWLNNDAFATDIPRNIQFLLNLDHYKKLDQAERNIQTKAQSANQLESLKKPDFYLLGPDNSDTLKKIKNQNLPIPPLFENLQISSLTILSPFATAKYDNIDKKNDSLTAQLNAKFRFEKNNDLSNNKNQDAQIKKAILSGQTSIESTNEILDNRIKRTILTDNILTDTLAKELKHRNINNLSDVVIITERDTKYGRKIARNFCKSFVEEKEIEKCKESHVFYYLRGLDAYQKTPTIDSKKQEKKENNALLTNDMHHPPVGLGQYDYLRRLADQIRDLDKNQPIKTIGIFGTDIYDKLLILQVLRQEFRNIIFFTTGLDAQMSHPQNWRWTKNLIVASSFDLKLNKDLQTSIPAFRDSYQTSLFFSTLLAIRSPTFIENSGINNPEDFKAKDWIKPLVFEIGRNGPVRLTQDIENYNVKSVHQTIETEFSKPELIAWGFIFALLILVYYLISSNSGVLVLLTTGAIIILGIIFYLGSKNQISDPLSLADGVSMWPTILIRTIVCLLIIVFFYKSIQGLEINFSRLSKEFFPQNYQDYPTLCNPNDLHFIKLSNIALIKHVFFLVIIVILAIKGILWILDYKILQQFKGYEFKLFIIATYVALIYFFCIKTKKLKFIKIWAENSLELKNHLSVGLLYLPNQKEKNNFVKKLWKEYYEYGRMNHRFMRTTMIFLLFIMVIALIFYLFPEPQSPCRGVTCDFDRYVFATSFTLMILLIFFSIDALKLCICWIKKLRKEYLLPFYGDRTEKELSKASEDQLEDLRNTVKLVAERTHEIDRLIYFPLIIIILMLIARNNYFDDLGFSQATGIIFVMNVSMLIAAGLLLRKEALALKSAAMKSIQTIAFYIPEQQKKIDWIKDDIQSIKYGAYLPLREHPAIRTILLVIGSIGLTYTEYKLFFG